MNMHVDEVRVLVSRLPEVYQPIYGHPELSEHASRATEDRFEDIRRVYEVLSDHLGRPLRVLDLGCAQGFRSRPPSERDSSRRFSCFAGRR